MSPFEVLEKRYPARAMRLIALFLAAIVFAFVVWAQTARLDEVSMAPGEIVPAGQVKVIQHLEGGIVEDIAVEEGQSVAPGDVLLRLTLGAREMRPEEIRIERDGLQLTKARLGAEANGTPLELPADEAARMPDVVATEREAYASRQREVANRIEGLEDKRRQREAELRGLRQRYGSVARNLGHAREQLRISDDLLESGLTSRVEHLSLSREVRQLQGEIGSLSGSINEAEAAISEAGKRIEEERESARRQALQELAQVEVKIRRLDEQMRTAVSQRQRTEIRSPIAGIVTQLRYNTVGGVVAPGSPIMEIVPSSDTLVVEAKLKPTDRGHVRVGMPATVKVSAYDFVRYGGVDGEVITVGADSARDEDGLTYFPVRIALASPHLDADEAQLPLTAGMETLVDIRTGERTVLAYLINPVLKLRSDAFRER